ncbi:MAG TPA: D-hexose-6-phosphate mutarotase [Chloroflexaceae bacterium]|nr:D-hexose-6-phosphate mutarotase [Chloroflexaceae bacterium]
MADQALAALNDRFGLAGKLAFVAGPSGLPHARIASGDYGAEVALQGAHVLAYGRRGEPPVLWTSRLAVFAPGKAVRGGVPVCWPWFGPHPSDPGKPAHGFARVSMWSVAASADGGDAVALTLGLRDDGATRALWPHPFALELSVRVGARLELALTATNTGDAPVTLGGALHSYFGVGAVTEARIMGLEGARYLDQLTGEFHAQQGPVTVAGEVDRIYEDAGPACTIVAPALGRAVRVAKSGSATTVVWNPWVEKARSLADLGDEEYHEMLCVETANAGADTVTLAPGARHTLGATIEVVPLS